MVWAGVVVKVVIFWGVVSEGKRGKGVLNMCRCEGQVCGKG